MHRRTAATSVIVVAALALAGCGRSETTTTEPSTSVEPSSTAAVVETDSIEGPLEVWAIGNEGELLPDLLTEFEETNPDVDVTVTAIPWEGYQDKLRTAVAGGQAPDVSMVGNPYAAVLAPTGGLDPVPTDLIAGDDFFEGSWDASIIDGISYAVPWYIDTRVIYYRTDLAEEAGLDQPTSWTELQDFTAGLQDAGAELGMYLQPSGNRNSLTLLPMVWQAGGDLVNEDKTEFTIDTDAWADAIAYYVSYFDQEISDLTYMQTGEYEPRFVNGDVGSFVSGPFDVAMVREQGGEGFDDVGLMTWPQQDGGDGPGTGYVGGGDLVVFEDTDNRDAAWGLVQWLTEPETQVEWFELSGDLPSNQAAWDDPALADDELVSVFGDQMDNAQALPGIATISEVLTAIDLELEKAVRGVVTPEEAAAAMQEEATSIGTGA